MEVEKKQQQPYSKQLSKYIILSNGKRGKWMF